jgi:uncharacterized membrane protein
MPARRSFRFWPHRAQSLLRDRRGAIAPMVAMLGASLLLAAGLALDVGLYRLGNRDLRAATEAAALAAAMDPPRAEARARDYLTRNGYDAGVLRQIEVGRYCADIGLAPDQRFDPTFNRCPGNGAANAVRLHTAKPSRRFLTGALGDRVLIPELAASATATRIDEAGVEITSGLLTVTNSLVNAVNDLLGALLGVKLRLSTADIESLLGGNVDAGLFFDALARRSGHEGTYGDLVAASHGLQDIALSAADAAGRPAAAAALRAFAGQVGNGYRVPLSGLFGLGVWADMPVGEADAQPALRAGLNAYQLVATAVQAGPGVIDASDLVSLAVPGSTVRIAAVATGPVDRPRFSFGPAGETEVGTSALRLQLLVGVGRVDVLGLGALTVDSLPVLIDVAAARAQVAAIECPDTPEQARDTGVTISAQSGLVNAYIGTPPANAMARPMPPLAASQIGRTRIVNALGLVTVDARAVAQPVLGASRAIAFGPGNRGTIGTPQAPGLPDSVGNGSQVGTTIGTLVGSLTASDGLDIRILGLCLPVVCAAQGTLLRNALLPALVTPLTGLVGSTADPLLDNVLTALGIQLGHATVWVNGVRCGVPVLV